MSGADFEQVLNGRPHKIPRPPTTARVVRVDGGIFAAPLDADTRHPIGPCRGPGVGPAGVMVGDVVLLVWTNERPWIAQVDGETDENTDPGGVYR